MALAHSWISIFVLDHAVPEGCAGSLVIREADQIAGVSFVDQFGDRARGEQRNIVRMGLNGGEHLPLMGLAGEIALDDEIVGEGVVIRRGEGAVTRVGNRMRRPA